MRAVACQPVQQHPAASSGALRRCGRPPAGAAVREEQRESSDPVILSCSLARAPTLMDETGVSPLTLSVAPVADEAGVPRARSRGRPSRTALGVMVRHARLPG